MLRVETGMGVSKAMKLTAFEYSLLEKFLETGNMLLTVLTSAYLVLLQLQ
jgi:hypothetical protein